MVKSAKIENGIAVNIIVGELEGYVPCPDYVGIGWRDVSGGWVEPVTATVEPAPLEQLRAKMSISPVQLRQRLRAAGLLADVIALTTQDDDLSDWFEYATSIERLHPAVAAVAAQLEKDDAWLDDFFTWQLE